MSGHDADVTLPSETLPADGEYRGARAELPAGASVGRYVVLSTVGSGGMGIVYAAYDPELDRRIAIKLLRAGTAGSTRATAGRTRLLREAQALAKLSHPNVVTIYDVGTLDEEVWLAMEFVAGRTLGAWLRERPRSWREIVTVLGRAGLGLAEAHTAGVLHRDFKPDNVMIDEESKRVRRVRVMDFGLARQHGDTDSNDSAEAQTSGPVTAGALAVELTHDGAVMGTPAYMSPEQLSGRRVGPKSDQFSFCATLWEALYGQRPFKGDTLLELATQVLEGNLRSPPSNSAPSWLRRICERGLAVDPEDRFETMTELLTALDSGRARAARSRAGAALAVVTAVSVGGIGYDRYERARQVAVCERTGQEVEDQWRAGERDAVFQALSGVDVSYAASTARAAIEGLDRHAAALGAARAEACKRSEVEQTWNASLLARASWCLDDRALEFAALTKEFGSADAKVIRSAAAATSGLPRIAPCIDTARLERLPDPPASTEREAAISVQERLAEGFALQAAGKPASAVEVVRVARKQAEELGWPPLLAAARRLEASNLGDTGAFEEAEAAYLQAYEWASRAGEWNEAARAAVELTFLVGATQSRAAEGRLWAMHASIALSFAHDPEGDLEGSRLGSLAGVEFYAGEYETALELFERSGEITRVVDGPQSPNYGRTMANIGLAHQSLGHYDETLEYYTKALEISKAALGPDHPTVALNLANLASYYRDVDKHEQAVAHYEQARRLLIAALGDEHPSVANLLHNLGNLRSDAGEFNLAKPLFERSIEIWTKSHGPDHRNVATALGNLGLLHYDLEEYESAIIYQRRALGIIERTLGEEHPKVAGLLSDLAQTRIAQKRFDDAKELLERALEIYELRDGEQFGESQAHFNLAKALAGLDAPDEVVQARIAIARAGFESLPDGASDLEAIESWVASRTRSSPGAESADPLSADDG